MDESTESSRSKKEKHKRRSVNDKLSRISILKHFELDLSSASNSTDEELIAYELNRIPEFRAELSSKRKLVNAYVAEQSRWLNYGARIAKDMEDAKELVDEPWTIGANEIEDIRSKYLQYSHKPNYDRNVCETTALKLSEYTKRVKEAELENECKIEKQKLERLHELHALLKLCMSSIQESALKMIDRCQAIISEEKLWFEENGFTKKFHKLTDE